MDLRICNKIDIDNYCVKYRCHPRIRAIYEKYDSEDLFVVSQESIVFEDLIKYISKKYRTRIFHFKLSETLDAAISMLVNPYFDELCDYIEVNINNIERKFLKFLKKEVFSFFVSANYNLFNDWIAGKGLECEVNNPNVVSKSNKIIALIDQYI